jgi:hypothetical protein
MTVMEKDRRSAVLVQVNDRAEVVREIQTSFLNSDLSVNADVATASLTPLLANRGLASRGFQLIGAGFLLSAEEAERLLATDEANADVIKQYRHGKDLTARPRGLSVIDFGTRDEDELRKYSVLYDIIRSRVKPERDANNDRSTRQKWWRFGRNREEFRPALNDLGRYIATAETSKHRIFVFFDVSVAPDNMLVCIASREEFDLGVLSSSLHVFWALAAGGRLGVGNDPRYNKTRCFDPFPFPDPPTHLRAQIGLVAEALDQHRKDAIARDERVTMTGMYNVVEKLRSGEKLTDKERAVHEIAACGVLRDLHDELDRLVARAYGWPWPMEREEVLERLVALHDERVEEEKHGIVRWLRPEYQVPRFGGAAPAAEEPALDLPEAPAAEAAAGGARSSPGPRAPSSRSARPRRAWPRRPPRRRRWRPRSPARPCPWSRATWKRWPWWARCASFPTAATRPSPSRSEGREATRERDQEGRLIRA